MMKSGNKDFKTTVDQIVENAKTKREKDLAKARQKGRVGRWLSGFSKEELKVPVIEQVPVAKPVEQQPAKPKATSTLSEFWTTSVNTVTAFFSEDAKKNQALAEKEQRAIHREEIAAKYHLNLNKKR